MIRKYLTECLLKYCWEMAWDFDKGLKILWLCFVYESDINQLSRSLWLYVKGTHESTTDFRTKKGHFLLDSSHSYQPDCSRSYIFGWLTWRWACHWLLMVLPKKHGNYLGSKMDQFQDGFSCNPPTYLDAWSSLAKVFCDTLSSQLYYIDCFRISSLHDCNLVPDNDLWGKNVGLPINYDMPINLELTP